MVDILSLSKTVFTEETMLYPTISFEHYKILLAEIKGRLKNAQLRVDIIVKYELIKFYWDIGKLIIESQKRAKWGNKLFEVLAKGLRRSFHNKEGFSERNLYNMRQFYLRYPDFEIFQALPAKLTGTHHVVLIQAFSIQISFFIGE